MLSSAAGTCQAPHEPRRQSCHMPCHGMALRSKTEMLLTTSLSRGPGTGLSVTATVLLTDSPRQRISTSGALRPALRQGREERWGGWGGRWKQVAGERPRVSNTY